MPVSAPPVADGAVAVRGGRITAVGRAAEVVPAHPDLAVEDLGDRILTPGFVDAHCHLEWSLLDGLLPPEPFGPWLGNMLALRLRMGPADHVAAARSGALRALRAGTTTLADSGPSGEGAAALTALGLRGLVHLEVFGREEGDAAAAAAAAYEERLPALDAAAGPRVQVGVSPHAPYTVGPALWAALRARAGLAGRPWATHVAESAAEEEVIAAGTGPLGDLFARAGLTPGRWPGGGGGAVPRMAGGGAFAPGLVAAHCVRLGAGDARVLAAAGVSVAHCPRSNVHLHCGRAPLEALRDAGARVGLGTDSPASGGDYDLRAEARAARDLQAAAVGLTAADLLRLATAGGAEALGMEDEVGALAAGLRADLVALADPGGGRTVEERAMDPAAAVHLVAVDGEILLRDGDPERADGAAIDREAAEARARLC
ncbi:MAG: amidohydrolase family protein [Thermoleophilia bacterium]